MNKTYVWTDVLCDDRSGMVVVIAPDDDAARDELIQSDLGGYLGMGLMLDRKLPTIYHPDAAPAHHVIWGSS